MWAAGVTAAVVASLALASPAAAQRPACSWWVGSNPDAVNIAYPDEGAAYWGTTLAKLPETGLVIRGRFPHARYFSIHAYDPLLRPTGAILDADVVPGSGANPFAGPSNAGSDGTYTVRILPERPPADPEPNTIYAGELFEGGDNPGGVVLYRVYVPDDAGDLTGGVGLPDVAIAMPGGAELPLGQCDIAAELPDSGLNRAVREASYPDAAPRTPPTRNETDPPRWSKFFGYATLLGLLPVNPVPPELVPGGGGFLSNVHNDYVSTGINRTYGEVAVFRALMPTFPDTRAGEPAAARRQLRYWSFCQNETFSQRFVACVADHEAVLDEEGRATFVISDPADRPANATREHGVNWLPWGGAYPEGRVIYRQMVASPAFAEAIASIAPADDVQAAMGEYHPDIAYCSAAAFEDAGADGCLSP